MCLLKKHFLRIFLEESFSTLKKKTFSNFKFLNLYLKCLLKRHFHNFEIFEFKLKMSLEQIFYKLLKYYIESVF